MPNIALPGSAHGLVEPSLFNVFDPTVLIDAGGSWAPFASKSGPSAPPLSFSSLLHCASDTALPLQQSHGLLQRTYLLIYQVTATSSSMSLATCRGTLVSTLLRSCRVSPACDCCVLHRVWKYTTIAARCQRKARNSSLNVLRTDGHVRSASPHALQVLRKGNVR